MRFSNLLTKRDFRSDVENLLLSDKDCKWNMDTANNNCFTDHRFGRALYVYPDYLRYWDDLRCRNTFLDIPLPVKEKELIDILSINLTPLNR